MFRRKRNRTDFDAEIEAHIELEAERLREQGLNEQDAQSAARRSFGNMTMAQERFYESSRWVWLDDLRRDLRVGLRSLLRTKGMAATVVAMLALGIGANAAIFTVVRGVLVRPLVNRDEDRLLYIRQSAPGLPSENTTFSMPEIEDFNSRVRTIGAFGDFSTINFTMRGHGEPRVVKAGVVGGSYFEVMGLRPVLGRLLDESDDGPDAAGAVVLTHQFWSDSFGSDPSVIGKTVELDTRSATIVGVLEPSPPYPAETAILANVVTSPHHLGATMVTRRTHRMTEVFGRLAPGASVEEARAELIATHAAIVGQYPEAYPLGARFELSVKLLRDQITAPARTVLLVLLATAAVIFVIACSNVANLILARSVRREGELAVRAALGGSRGALRRTLLAESLLLCGAGAVFGVILAGPLVAALSRFAAQFSVRALEVTVDQSLLWVGAGLAILAAVLLAYLPRLPSPQSPTGLGPAGNSRRVTSGTSRRLRAFATTQIAFSFVLLSGAGMLLAALVTLQTASTGYNLRQVLVVDVPEPALGISAGDLSFHREVTRRIEELPGVEGVAVGSFVPWRDAGRFGPGFRFAVEGYVPADGEQAPHARMRFVAPGFFGVLGVPLLAGREFNEGDRRDGQPVVVVSESMARRVFPTGEALNRNMWWSDPDGEPQPRRIVGVVADVDDENIVPGPAITVYQPIQQGRALAGRLFVHTTGDPYALVAPVTKIVRELAPNRPIERPATLEHVRAEVLAPDRLNAFVFSGFAGIALLIAVVGVAGVLAFSVSTRRREFGVRLAIGAQPGHLVGRVLWEAALIVVFGLAAGAAGGAAFAAVAAAYLDNVRFPGALPILVAAAVLVGAALLASLIPAVRASRVDVLQALRSD